MIVRKVGEPASRVMTYRRQLLAESTEALSPYCVSVYELLYPKLAGSTCMISVLVELSVRQ